MIAYPSLLVPAAVQAGMSVPADPDADFNKEEFPHFWVFRQIQCGAPMPSPDAHWENAKVIAKLSVAELKTVTMFGLVKLGCQFGYTTP